MIFHPTEPRVAAVLDWELSTLGDPLADFTYLLMNWGCRRTAAAVSPASTCRRSASRPGEETVALYCGATGRAGLPDLDWYLRLQRVPPRRRSSQGIAKRIVEGTAANERAREAAERAAPLAEAAWKYAEKAGA